MTLETNFMVGGEAGQGVQSVGLLLARALARGGYHIFADQDYESRVRGGHNFFRVRAADRPVGAVSGVVDVLVALNGESLARHLGELAAGGTAIFDVDKEKPAGDERLFGLPLEKLAEAAGGRIMANTAALGAALALAEYDFDVLAGVIGEHFGGGEAAEGNVRAARAGYDYVRENFRGEKRPLGPREGPRRLLLTGNEALSLGALAAGCRFMAAYPMTPASSIMEYLAAKAGEFHLVMLHAEDEIAAVNMAIGAAYAGARAMTATSGSGLCLMVEGIGLAGITETPLVVVDAQRPGPAIGLPTRTEQGDLQFVLHAHHGDFPRAVLAPADTADAFWTMIKAFNWAEKYQLPVIVLTDHHLASSYATVEPFDLGEVVIDRGLLFEDREAAGYQRHRLTPSGVSPRAFPGRGAALVVTDADEHDEDGHLTEEAGMRKAQVQKRLRKLISLKQELGAPRRAGPPRVEVLLIGWGSTLGAIREAVDILNEDGLSTGMLHLNELWPLPARAVAEALDGARKGYIVEGNATGQLSRLIRMETGWWVGGQILRFDGRPLTPAEIVEAVKEGVS